MSAHIDAIKRIARLCGELGPDELRVLERVAQRLAMGRKHYGLLNIEKDQREWTKEATEEVLDMSAYLALAMLKRE